MSIDLRDIFHGRSVRSALLFKNVLGSFMIKGWSAVIVFLMVPLTLKCLGTYQNGVWLTISSIIVWIDQMDIGLGNGLRTRITMYIANDDKINAQKVVSSTFAMLVCLMIPVSVFLVSLVWFSDVYSLLNVDAQRIPELRVALASAIVIVCVTFVFKLINNVYMGLQLPAISNLIITLGQTLALLSTAILYYVGVATFINVVLVNTLAPLLIYVLAYPYTFFVKYKWLNPSISKVSMQSAFEIGKFGVKYFWLQIVSVLQFSTANILISLFFGPDMVTPYQIAYRYMSIVVVGFTIVCMPFWNATADAFARNDREWIKKANSKMNYVMICVCVCLSVMVVVSPWVYSIWIGEECYVPMSLTVMTAIYIMIFTFSMRYSYFLNGIGALRLQLYMTIFAVLFVPLEYVFHLMTNSMVCFMCVFCACLIPPAIVNAIQLHKYVNNKAVGVWRI